ncbi:hypothetical protein MTR67_051368 [Solanum verrucosum]|uniref:Uncharacterized protein n=1 Tax=Solanum verrucosum TaxID=315347 RepID=A0AAF0V357_SOLVR|nr:hypothetical protein MTR67_051368 [Solanum verrucosum]
MDISLFEQPNFQRAYLTHTNSELCKLSGVEKIIPRCFQQYLEIHLNHIYLGVITI